MSFTGSSYPHDMHAQYTPTFPQLEGLGSAPGLSDQVGRLLLKKHVPVHPLLPCMLSSASGLFCCLPIACIWLCSPIQKLASPCLTAAVSMPIWCFAMQASNDAAQQQAAQQQRAAMLRSMSANHLGALSAAWEAGAMPDGPSLASIGRSSSTSQLVQASCFGGEGCSASGLHYLWAHTPVKHRSQSRLWQTAGTMEGSKLCSLSRTADMMGLAFMSVGLAQDHC